MLRTNLSTRPFYNDRAVRAALAGVAAIALGLTVFNAIEIIRLRSQDSQARQTIARNDEQARQLRSQAEGIRRSIDQARLLLVQTAAGEANALIDRRTFSWTELLNHFQRTLPPDVRISGVLPKVENDGRVLVDVSVISRRVEDLEEFMDALEKTGVFSAVLSRTDRPTDSGTVESQLQAYYRPAAAPSPGASAGQAVPAAPSSESGRERPGNQSASGNVSAGGPQ